MYAVALHTGMQYDCNSYAVILQHVCSRTAKYMQQECKQDAVKMCIRDSYSGQIGTEFQP